MKIGIYNDDNSFDDKENSSKAPVSQLVNAEVNSGNTSTSNYTLQLRIRECHAGMKCDLKVSIRPPPPHPTDGFSPLTLHPTPWNFSCGGSLNTPPPPPAKFLFHLNRRPLQIYHENTAMSKLHIEYTMLDLNLSSRI